MEFWVGKTQNMQHASVTQTKMVAFGHLNGFVDMRLGWSSRTQFEETWATLLGVLVTQPITMDQEEETQQEVYTHKNIVSVSLTSSMFKDMNDYRTPITQFNEKRESICMFRVRCHETQSMCLSSVCVEERHIVGNCFTALCSLSLSFPSVSMF